MPRCKGTTKAGDRCRRNAIEGSGYCPAHQGQSSGSEPDASGTAPEKRGADLILIGAVALALLALRRVIRL